VFFATVGLEAYPLRMVGTAPGRVLDHNESGMAFVGGTVLASDGANSLEVGASVDYSAGDAPPIDEFTVAAFVKIDATATTFSGKDISIASSMRLVTSNQVLNTTFWTLFVREHPVDSTKAQPGCRIGQIAETCPSICIPGPMKVEVVAAQGDDASLLDAGTWHHLACMHSVADETFVLYVNGEVYSVTSYDDVETVYNASTTGMEVDDAMTIITFQTDIETDTSETSTLEIDELMVFAGAVDAADLGKLESIATNLAPVLDEEDLETATATAFKEGTVASVALPVTDDRQATTALQYTVDPDTASIDNTATLKYNIPYNAVVQPANESVITFAVTATDSDGATITFDVDLTVEDENRAPFVLFDADDSNIFQVKCAETDSVTVNVTGDDLDAEEESVTVEPLFSLASPDVSFDAVTGEFSYTPSRGTVTSVTGFQFVNFAFSAVDSLGLASDEPAKVIRVNVTAYPTPAPTPAPTASVQPTPAPLTPAPATPAPETPAPESTDGPADAQSGDGEGLDTQSLIIIIAVSAAGCIMLAIGLGFFFSSRGKSSGGGSSTEMASAGTTGGGAAPSKRLKVEWLESDEEE
jgi:hypothetical protein